MRRTGQRKRAPPAWGEALLHYCIARSGGEFAQHILEDAAVQEIFQFVDGIDAAQRGEAEGRPIGARDLHLNILAGLEVGDTFDGEAVIALEA